MRHPIQPDTNASPRQTAQAAGPCARPHRWICHSATAAATSAHNNVQQARQAGSGPRSTATGGAVREGTTGESGARNETVAGLHRPDPAAQPARRNTSVPLVPPKPKLFFTATSIFISRAALAQ